VRAFRCSRLTVKQRDMQRSARLGGWELISGFTPTGLSVIEVLKTPQEDGLTWRAPWSRSVTTWANGRTVAHRATGAFVVFTLAALPNRAAN